LQTMSRQEKLSPSSTGKRKAVAADVAGCAAAGTDSTPVPQSKKSKPSPATQNEFSVIEKQEARSFSVTATSVSGPPACTPKAAAIASPPLRTTSVQQLIPSPNTDKQLEANINTPPSTTAVLEEEPPSGSDVGKVVNSASQHPAVMASDSDIPIKTAASKPTAAAAAEIKAVAGKPKPSEIKKQPHPENSCLPSTTRLQYVFSPYASEHPDQTSIGFLVCACVCAVFSDMNTVSPLLTIGFPLFWLAAICGHDETQENDRKENDGILGRVRYYARLIAVYYLPLCLCRARGGVDYFHLEDISKLKSYGIVLLILLPVMAFFFLALLAQKRAWQQIPLTRNANENNADYNWRKLSHSLVFPILVTALFQILFRFSPIGAAGNPVMGLAVIIGLPIQQGIVSVFGEIGLVFGIALIATLGAGSLVGRTTKSQWMVLGIAYAAVQIAGGWKLAEGLWENPIEKWSHTIAPTLQVSCLCSDDLRENDTSTMIDEIHYRLGEGDDLVVLSEASLEGRITHEQILWPKDNPGAAVAVAFLEEINGTDKFRNSVELLQAGGSVFRYDKNRPVPIMESIVTGGSRPPAAVEVSFTPRNITCQGGHQRTNVTLKVGAAICFDFDFPDVLRHASNADLVVGPSNYWASLGWSLWSDNRYRAVEGGFTLFKCSRDGISGAVDPLGRTLWQRPTVAGNTVTTQIPIQKGRPTIYANWGGFLFGWICLFLFAPLCLFRTYFGQGI